MYTNEVAFVVLSYFHTSFLLMPSISLWTPQFCSIFRIDMYLIYDLCVYNHIILLRIQSYASILYLRLPSAFRIILRGEDILHHNIVNDMMMSQEVTYKPQAGVDGLLPKDSNVMSLCLVFPNLYWNLISSRSCDRWLLLLPLDLWRMQFTMLMFQVLMFIIRIDSLR